MDLKLYSQYKSREVTRNLDQARKSMGPGGDEGTPVESDWSKVGGKVQSLKGETLAEYCEALLCVGLARDKGYTQASRGFMRALGVTTAARKAYQRALLLSLNGIT